MEKKYYGDSEDKPVVDEKTIKLIKIPDDIMALYEAMKNLTREIQKLRRVSHG